MKINNPFKKTTLAALIALTLSPVLAQAEALEAVSSNDKLMHVRPAGNLRQKSALKVELSTEKNSYRANEKIRFRVKSNKDVYIYMFNIDPISKKGLLLLPNRLQTKHQIKYPGDKQWHLLPNKNLEFYSDRAGRERIVMVASEKYIDIEKKLKSMNNKSVGDFYMMNSPLDDLEAGINETYNAGASNDKLVHLRSSKPTSPTMPKGIVIKEVNLRIR